MSDVYSEPDEWNPPEITIDNTWNVRCFSTPSFDEYKPGDRITSPNFYGDKYNGTKYCLWLYPKGFNEKCGDWASLFVFSDCSMRVE